MDIDPLWAIGGCIRFLSSICMAKTKTPSSCSSSSSSLYSSSSSSSSSSTPTQTSSKSHPFLLFLSVAFFFLLLVAQPAHQIRQSNMVSEPITQTLAATSLATSSFATTSTSNNFRPKDHSLHGKALPSKDHLFEGDEHEVPSGPNPISN